MQGEEIKHPVVDHLKPIGAEEKASLGVSEGTLHGEMNSGKSVHEPPYTIDELMGDMPEVTRETLAEETHESPPTPKSTSIDAVTPNKSIPTAPLVTQTKKLDISSSHT